MRTEYIRTKVRPFKKLFVIEPGDYSSFAKIFLEIQNEIDSINNLIFVNNEKLFSVVSKDFVKRSDPDIILNLSSLDDDRLSDFFGISSVKPISENFKIGRFGTTIDCFTHLPDTLNKFFSENEINKDILSANRLENVDVSLFACINYGLFPEEIQEHLEFSIFKELTPRRLSTNIDLIDNLFEKNKKFCQLTNQIGGFGGSRDGTSIYEIDYNSEGYFSDSKKYFIVSAKDDFETITYFWNIRSYYTNSNIAWVPITLLGQIGQLVEEDSTFVCFDKESLESIEKNYSSTKIIQPSRLHFRNRNERWKFYEHDRTINIDDEELIIQHPVGKSFSDIGLGCAFVLEIIGLEEFVYPKRRNLGELFFPKHYEHNLFEERFLRISENGLSKYVVEFHPLSTKDVVETIRLPSFSEAINHLFKDIGYNLKRTQKSSILEQSVNLLGSLNNLELISKQEIFELLVSLTPNVRTEKAVKKLLKEIELTVNPDDVLGILGEIRENGGVNFPSVTYTIEEILGKSSLNGNSKKQLLPYLQELYNLGIFLRGKFFKCPKCESNLWIQIDDVARQNYCVECNNEVKLPVYLNNKQSSDHYRLNQLFVRAIDQGQLATLLLLNFFYIQKYRAFNYLSNIEIYSSDKLLTDVDLLIRIGKKIGLCECKSTGGFNLNQAIELVELGKKFKCDFIAFSCLNNLESKEINELMERLRTEDVNFPIFILGSESLFKPNSRIIQSFFELRRDDTFKTGPFIIK